MAILETLTKVPKALREIGWSKAVELVRVARREGAEFDCATRLHRTEELPKGEFKCTVKKHLNEGETEPWEILYFKVYKSQLRVVEQAIEVAGVDVGNWKSRVATA